MTRAGADDSLSSQIDTLTASSGENTAAITAESVARTDADSTLAGQINTISAANDANAAAISAEQVARVDADESLSSSMTTLSASVGSAVGGGNDVPNSDLVGTTTSGGGYDGWTFTTDASPVGSGINLPGYFSSAGVNVLWSTIGGQPTALNCNDWASPRMAAQPGVAYEASVAAAYHRAAYAQLFIGFADVNGTILAYAGGWTGGTSVDVVATAAQNGDLANFSTIGGFATAPAGTCFRFLLLRVVADGTEQNPYGFFTHPFTRAAAASQTVLSPYSSGTQANVPVIEASISNEATARATADDAISDTVSALTSTVDANSAAISQEAVTRADADSALSSTIDTLTSTVDGNSAAITAEAATRATADESLSGQINTVLAQTNDNAASIQTETAARTDADSALTDEITSLNSQVGDNTAAISSESVARSTADQALSTSIATVSSSVNGNTASIQQISESLNGVLVQYGLVGTIDGETGGLILTGAALPGGGAVFDLIIKANVEIDGDLLLAGTLDQAALDAASYGNLVSPHGGTFFGSGSGDFTVPAGVTWLYVELRGGDAGPITYFFTDANGTNQFMTTEGPLGGYAYGTLNVTPGQVIYYVVGGYGGAQSNEMGGASSTGGSSSFGPLTATGGRLSEDGSGNVTVDAPGQGSGGLINLSGAPYNLASGGGGFIKLTF